MDCLTARKRLGLTQDEFAAKLGMKQRAIRRWEREGTEPHPKTQHAIELLIQEKEMSQLANELAAVGPPTKGKKETMAEGYGFGILPSDFIL